MLRLILISFLTLSFSCVSSKNDLNFIYFTQHGYGDSRTTHFIIFEDEKYIKGLKNPESESALKSPFILKQISSNLCTINKSSPIVKKYCVTYEINGKREQFLLDKNWLPLLRKIEKHLPKDKKRFIEAMIFYASQ